ncbi:MAG: hypothetical protein A2X64_02430 [Ignavibacteria bacterium GWF2_33_9]|nr:MAG: hypothetical protein A2X64_02430 [Ignavibacteria bacterium GWF2_33_9]
MNILFLTPRLPFPLIGGDRVKPYFLLKHIAQKHKVTLVTFYQGKEDPANYIKEIENIGVEVFTIPLNPFKAGLSCFFRGYKLRPIEILYYFSNNFQKKVDELLSTRKYDIGFSFFMRTAEYLQNKNIKKILIAEDSRILYQSRSYQETINPLQKMVRYYEFLTLKNYEPSIIRRFNATTFVTQEDISFAKSNSIKSIFRLLTNGTDVDYFIPADFNKRKNILFTGKFDVWANQLMVERIIKKIMPKVKEIFPNIIFSFVGANPTKILKDLAEKNKIDLHSNVPTMLPYLQNARIYLHPHRGATGIQNKLLEALSAGCPVVTTTSGNQGIYGKHKEHLMIGLTDEEIANNIIELLHNEELSKQLSKNARELIIQTHSWEKIYSEFDAILEEFAENE